MLFAKDLSFVQAAKNHLDEILEALKTFYVHQHLDWESLSDQIQSGDVFLCYQNQKISGMLSISGIDSSNQWVKLFAVRSETQKHLMWDKLIGFALSMKTINTFYSIAFWDWYRKLILRVPQFSLYEQIVTLETTEPIRQYPINAINGTNIRKITENDIESIAYIDDNAFDSPWRLGKNNLHSAVKQSKIKELICYENTIIGYLLADYEVLSAHLSRVAVLPSWAGKGLASQLVITMLNELHDQGVFSVSVNTQGSNPASIHLYQKFGFVSTNEKIPVFRYFADKKAKVSISSN